MNTNVDGTQAPGPEALGEHLLRLRQRLGWKLRPAAREAGVDPTWLSRLEHGVYASPDPRAVAKVARAYSVDVEELYIVAGLSSGRGLPGFAPYLRAKYELPTEAVAQLEAHFELLNAKYRPEGEFHDHNHHNTA